MQSKQLEWKEFSVDLQAVDAKLKADYPDNYCGNQAHSVLELYFTGELTEQMKEDINAFWEALDEASAVVVSYKSTAQIAADVAAKKASAKAKLAALGLDPEEIKAIVG